MFGMSAGESHAYRQGRQAVERETELARQSDYIREVFRRRAQPKAWTWQDEALRLKAVLLERESYIVELTRRLVATEENIGVLTETKDLLEAIIDGLNLQIKEMQ